MPVASLWGPNVVGNFFRQPRCLATRELCILASIGLAVRSTSGSSAMSKVAAPARVDVRSSGKRCVIGRDEITTLPGLVNGTVPDQRLIPPHANVTTSHATLATHVIIRRPSVYRPLPMAITLPPPARIPNADQSPDLLKIMASTSSIAQAWAAYSALRCHPSSRGIPVPLLHRLAHLLVSTKPRTRLIFMRLRSLTSHIQKAGGQVTLRERNALIDTAGKGWRRINATQFRTALDVFKGVFRDQRQAKADPSICTDRECAPNRPSVEPTIVTYTTLLDIAARTRSSRNVEYASSLLKTSGLAPNRITHLSLLRYFSKTKQLHGVRATLKTMREQGLEIGLDGVNAVLWAYAYNNHTDVASILYRVLQHNAIPEVGDHDIDFAIQYLADKHRLIIPANMIPDDITYITTMQMFAYRGDLLPALQVFCDMASAIPPSNQKAGTQPTRARNRALSAFRALFLGFARHAPRFSLPARLTRLDEGSGESQWTLRNLEALFNEFLSLPKTLIPSERLVYWILTAFSKASNHDETKLREVLKRLEDSFGRQWQSGRLGRFRRQIMS
jgi:hypothetical protein